MPLNTLRLNQKTTHPNDRIVFIKPLPGPDKGTSQDFLNRLAAICVPIMRKHWLSVTTLEEYEPNREFWGRNFNAGECIQLVLKSPRTGRWLPFRFVAVVLMHELAHNEQMNHGRDFWKTNNRNRDELKELWAKGYTGEGMWGRGRNLYDGQIADDAPLAQEDMPQHLCGGTYRTRRKRARKPKLSYQEQKERRIRKKFGEGGTALGEDEVQRRYLENGKFAAGRPRVAQSKRGRELRANALLDRLEREKAEKEQKSYEATGDDGSETESYDEHSDDEKSARDRDGSKLKDAQGHDMIRVCDDDSSETSLDAMHELDELRGLSTWLVPAGPKGGAQQASNKTTADENGARHNVEPGLIPPNRIKVKEESSGALSIQQRGKTSEPPIKAASAPTVSPRRSESTNPDLAHEVKTSKDDLGRDSQGRQEQICAVCSLANSEEALICLACANVLNTDRMPRYWRCNSETCQGTEYINPEDAGLCGLCGAKKNGDRV